MFDMQRAAEVVERLFAANGNKRKTRTEMIATNASRSRRVNASERLAFILKRRITASEGHHQIRKSRRPVLSREDTRPPNNDRESQNFSLRLCAPFACPVSHQALDFVVALHPPSSN